MKTTIALTAIIAAAICTPAMAEMSVQQKAQFCFNKMDTNRDGLVSRAEFDAFGQWMFTDSDTNDDNVLSLQEVAAAKQKEMIEMKNAKYTYIPMSGTNSMKGSSTVNLPNRTNVNPTDHSMNPTNPSQSDR